MKKIALILFALLYAMFLVCCTQKETTEVSDGLYINMNGDLYCIIYNDLITVSRVVASNEFNEEYVLSDTFKFIMSNNIYEGCNERNAISFWFYNDELTLSMNNKKYKLFIDKEVKKNEQFIKLDKPRDININSSQINWYLINNKNPYELGIMNVCIKVISKYDDVCIATEIIDYISSPASMFLFDAKQMNLDEGEYLLQIQYKGGLYLVDGMINLSVDSDNLLLSLIVNNTNDYQISCIIEGE
ncbi:MAG: hypothetical protein IJS58_05065 [Bacilli bacterium]|nr:hypothetical protein [Bacilli bacterium]